MSVAYDLFPAEVPAEFPAVHPAGSPADRPVAPRLFLVPPGGRPATAPARPDVQGRPAVSPAATRAGDVAVLLPPADPTPVRLTRRGVVAVAMATALLAGVLVLFAALSAHAHASDPAGSAGSAGHAPAAVVVHPGDTLWSIATANAPGTDPRAEVATLQRLNHLSGASLVPGQRLRLR